MAEPAVIVMESFDQMGGISDWQYCSVPTHLSLFPERSVSPSIPGCGTSSIDISQVLRIMKTVSCKLFKLTKLLSKYKFQ